MRQLVRSFEVPCVLRKTFACGASATKFEMRSSILVACIATEFLNAPSLTKQEGEVARLIDQDAPAAVEVLERLVNVNSGTYNPAGVIAVDKQIESQLQSLGFNTLD